MVIIQGTVYGRTFLHMYIIDLEAIVTHDTSCFSRKWSIYSKGPITMYRGFIMFLYYPLMSSRSVVMLCYLLGFLKQSLKQVSFKLKILLP